MIVWLHLDAGVVRAKPPSNRDRLPLNAAVLPRPPVGGDDDPRQSGLGRMEGGMEHQGAGVERVPLSPGRTAKELKALRLKAEKGCTDSYSCIVCVCDQMVV